MFAKALTLLALVGSASAFAPATRLLRSSTKMEYSVTLKDPAGEFVSLTFTHRCTLHPQRTRLPRLSPLPAAKGKLVLKTCQDCCEGCWLPVKMVELNSCACRAFYFFPLKTHGNESFSPAA